MPEESRVPTPEDRVLRYLDGTVARNPRGVPLHRLLQQLKGELSGLDFARLDVALRSLEALGYVRRDWYGPGDFLVMLTPRGRERVEGLLGVPPPEPAPAPREDEAARLKEELNTLRGELDQVYRNLTEATERHRLDRETLEEVLAQLEVQAQRIHELEDLLAKATGPPPEGSSGAG
jgi:hypothetical protein